MSWGTLVVSPEGMIQPTMSVVPWLRSAVLGDPSSLWVGVGESGEGEVSSPESQDWNKCS